MDFGVGLASRLHRAVGSGVGTVPFHLRLVQWGCQRGGLRRRGIRAGDTANQAGVTQKKMFSADKHTQRRSAFEVPFFFEISL